MCPNGSAISVLHVFPYWSAAVLISNPCLRCFKVIPLLITEYFSHCQSVLKWAVGGHYEKCARARTRLDFEGYDWPFRLKRSMADWHQPHAMFLHDLVKNFLFGVPFLIPMTFAVCANTDAEFLSMVGFFNPNPLQSWKVYFWKEFPLDQLIEWKKVKRGDWI